MTKPLLLQFVDYRQVCQENGDHELGRMAGTAIEFIAKMSFGIVLVHGTPFFIDAVLSSLPLLKPYLANDRWTQTPGFRFRFPEIDSLVNRKGTR